jgi:hypothetical protein
MPCAVCLAFFNMQDSRVPSLLYYMLADEIDVFV